MSFDRFFVGFFALTSSVLALAGFQAGGGGDQGRHLNAAAFNASDVSRLADELIDPLVRGLTPGNTSSEARQMALIFMEIDTYLHQLETQQAFAAESFPIDIFIREARLRKKNFEQAANRYFQSGRKGSIETVLPAYRAFQQASDALKERVSVLQSQQRQDEAERLSSHQHWQFAAAVALFVASLGFFVFTRRERHLLMRTLRERPPSSFPEVTPFPLGLVADNEASFSNRMGPDNVMEHFVRVAPALCASLRCAWAEKNKALFEKTMEDVLAHLKPLGVTSLAEKCNQLNALVAAEGWDEAEKGLFVVEKEMMALCSSVGAHLKAA